MQGLRTVPPYTETLLYQFNLLQTIMSSSIQGATHSRHAPAIHGDVSIGERYTTRNSRHAGSRPVSQTRDSAVAGSSYPLVQRGGAVTNEPANVQIVHRDQALEQRDNFVTRMQANYQQELQRFDNILPEKMSDARTLHAAFQALTEKLEKDSASVKQTEINHVMTLAENYFGVNWKRDTQHAGFAYQWVSHPSSVLGIVPSTLYAHSKKISTALTATGFSAQLLYALVSFMPLTFVHSMVFQGQFRLAAQSAKTTSDSIKTPTLAAALSELQNATAEFARVTGQSDEPEVASQFSAAYDRLLKARAECAKVEAKFNIEQNALYYTSCVRSARAVVSMTASVTGLLTRNAPLGLVILAVGTALTMLAQICAGLPDTSNKAAAQNRLMPRATNVLEETARQLDARRASSSAQASGSENATPPGVDEISRPTEIQAETNADAGISHEELTIFIKTLHAKSLSGRLEMRTSLLERRFDLEKRKAMQELADVYGMPECDSYMRLQYLNSKQDLAAEEDAERNTLTGQFSAALPAAEQRKADECRASITRVNSDIAALKRPDWNALSDEGKDALVKELNASNELENYKNLTDIKYLLPTVFRAIDDGLLDLTKPEQVTPVAINKCVQVFTMLIGGPAIPQLASATLALVRKIQSNENPQYKLPAEIVALPVVLALFSLYGSRFGPYAATHTVQLRSDLKNKMARGQLNIPAGGRMYLSKQFWKLFAQELPGSVVAQGTISWRLNRLSNEYKKSDQLLATHNEKIREHQQVSDLEAGQRNVGA